MAPTPHDLGDMSQNKVLYKWLMAANEKRHMQTNRTKSITSLLEIITTSGQIMHTDPIIKIIILAAQRTYCIYS